MSPMGRIIDIDIPPGESEAPGGLEPDTGLFTGPPPDTGLFTPPGAVIGQSRPNDPAYDQWGNLKENPLKTIEETHGGNFVKIFINEYRGAFYFGFQFRVERVIRQKKANIKDRPLDSPDAAGAAARKIIIKICKENHAIKRLFAEFAIIVYNQPELF